MTKEITFKDILARTKGYHRTSSILNLKDTSIVLITSYIQFGHVAAKVCRNNLHVVALCSSRMTIANFSEEELSRMRPFFVPNPSLLFFQIHNYVNRNRMPQINEYAPSAYIHSKAEVGGDGMRYFFETGSTVPVRVLHMGSVILGRRVAVGPYSVINRAVLDSTIIGDDCKIGSFVNIGHNTIIGSRTAITPHVCIGGSVLIGEDCWIGMSTTIRNHVHICNGVKIGMGSLVTKDIKEPGLYYGSPATGKGEWDGKW